jgi:pimeloyl-ACP methyl ester carboxylesterase
VELTSFDRDAGARGDRGGAVKRAAAAWLVLLACGAEPLPIYPAGTPFRTRDLVVAGTRLRLIDTGSGPAVVFLHGFGASLYTWRHQIEPVLQAGHRVVAYDNRGFGFSDRPDSGYGNAAYTDLLVALLDSLRIADAVLVGHSMGGQIAAEVAAVAPGRVRGLVLLDPSGHRGPVRALALRRLVTPLLTRTAVAAILRFCFADPQRVTAQDIDQYYAPVASPGGRTAIARVLSEYRFDTLRGMAGDITAPTLVLWGALDHIIEFAHVADLANELPRAAVSVIRDAGHNPHEEQSLEVNRQLIAYLRYGLPATPPDLAAGRSNGAVRSIPSRSRGGSGSGAAD